MKATKLVAALLALILVVVLAACAAPAAPQPASEPASEPASKPASEPTSESAPAGEVKLTDLIVGASPAPHAEILEAARPALEKLGYNLVVKEFTDYVMPNKALDNGELDANFFQHKPYLDNFNKENGTKIETAAYIHCEPLGFYSGKSGKDLLGSDESAIKLDIIPDGAEIAVPNDPSNEARALQLLEKIGIIKLKADVGLEATVQDIVENPKNVKVTELEAAQIPRVLPDVDFAVINGNYAIDAGVTDKILTTESKDSEGAMKFANIIAVRESDVGSAKTKALVEALQSDEVRKFIVDKFTPLAIPAF